ncbi:MAG: beta-ketoacyl-ACP synthase II [Anaerolineales bacterium]
MTLGSNNYRRAVITGVGATTPLGTGLEKLWQGLLAGRSGIRKIQQFDASDIPCQIAGEIPDFVPTDFIPAKEARRMSRSSQIALAAIQMAVEDSGLEEPLAEHERIGVILGTAVGGLERSVEGARAYREDGVSKVNPFTIPSSIANMSAFHIAERYGALGPSMCLVTACATGTQIVGEAAQTIRSGRADIVLAAGTEAMIQGFAVAGFSAMRALPTNYNDDPERASRPFDAKREGFVFSEGAAGLVIESLDGARKRGAHIYAEIAGHANSSDAFDMVRPDPTGAGALRTMRWALEDAQISPDGVDYINAHGTSTPANDPIETLAIKTLFGEGAYGIPISSTKSMIGHPMGASGAIEAIVCVLTIDRGVIHPTINLENPDPDCDLDYVPHEAREADVRVALSNSFGLGGQNACLVLKKV